MADPAGDRGGPHGDRPCPGERHDIAPSAGDDLAARIRDGDREAEARLVATYLPRVRRVVLLRTGNLDVANDLSQEVIVSTLEALRQGRLRRADSLVAYIDGVARNTVGAYFRTRTTRAEISLRHHESPTTTRDEVEAAELQAAVARGLRRLKPLDRAILHLLLVEDLTLVSIADRLRLSPEAVRQRKARALRRIRGMVQNAAST